MSTEIASVEFVAGSNDSVEEPPFRNARIFMLETNALQRISTDVLAICLRRLLAAEGCLGVAWQEHHRKIHVRVLLPDGSVQMDSFHIVMWFRSLIERVNDLLVISGLRFEERNGYVNFHAEVEVRK